MLLRSGRSGGRCSYSGLEGGSLGPTSGSYRYLYSFGHLKWGVFTLRMADRQSLHRRLIPHTEPSRPCNSLNHGVFIKSVVNILSSKLRQAFASATVAKAQVVYQSIE